MPFRSHAAPMKLKLPPASRARWRGRLVVPASRHRPKASSSTAIASFTVTRRATSASQVERLRHMGFDPPAAHRPGLSTSAIQSHM
jgi:hypothetical protein